MEWVVTLQEVKQYLRIDYAFMPSVFTASVRISLRIDFEEESRHLGLDFSRKEEGSITQTMMKELERQLDIELLLEMTRRSVNVPDKPERRKRALASMNIWIARNKESFSFIYAEHTSANTRNKEYSDLRRFHAASLHAGHRPPG